MQGFRTVAGRAEGLFEDRGSKFYGFVYPVETEQEALDFRHLIREEIPTANHYVSAWILHDGSQHYSDAKEPHGTAGLPVFNVISGHELQDVVCVVARIFGGTLLGRGGLMRAYTTAAQRAVAASHIVERVPCRDMLINIAYPSYERIAALLADRNVMVLDTAFADTVTLEARVRTEEVDAVQLALTEQTNGAAEIIVGDESLQFLDAAPCQDAPTSDDDI